MATDLDTIIHDLRETEPVPEGSSFTVSFTVQDEDEAAVAGTSLDTLTLTLYNDRDAAIINARDETDILGAAGGAVDADGAGTWQATPDDAPIVRGSLSEEDHTVMITWKWTPSGTQKTGRALVRLRVVNLEKVT